MKQLKVHGRKVWNSGWPNRSKGLRKRVNRAIERAFRQTEREVVDEGLDEADDAAEAAFKGTEGLTRGQILSQLDALDEIARCGALPASFEAQQDWLEEALETAV